MLIIEIQENIIKAQNALRQLESNSIYKSYKTLGGKGKLEQELRTVLTELIGLRNSFIYHVESIIRTSENKDLLRLIDMGYFERYANAASTESLVRIASFNDFRIPETSKNVIAENKQAINEMQSITNEIKSYNNLIKDFRQKTNKYFLTFYKVPENDELPDVISGTANIEGILPNVDVLASYVKNKSFPTIDKPKLLIQPKNEIQKVKIIRRNEKTDFKKVKIIKKK